MTNCSVILHTSSTFWQFVFGLNGQKIIYIDACALGGVEKIKENDKNTKIENLQNGQEKYGGKTSRTRTVGAKIKKKIIISSNFSLKLL